MDVGKFPASTQWLLPAVRTLSHFSLHGSIFGEIPLDQQTGCTPPSKPKFTFMEHVST